MAHGKETPRQKMIGMMYLVLTALLALNVSKDVLDAFVIVDEGLTKTTKNFVEKNQSIYKEFEQKAIENPQKVTKWKDYALEVKKRSDQLYDYMQQLKFEIVRKSDGENPEAIKDGQILGMKLKAKDNLDIPAQIMVGDNNNGKGVGLKANINDYREFLISLIADNAPTIKESLKKDLDTSDPPVADGVIHTWVSEHFEHLPLIAVITILSSLQSNIRNAESDVLRYLYSQIDASAFKFNQLEAIVLPKSNYVIRGDSYEARLFIAAFDTTQPPRILIGSYDKKVLPDGTIDYVMKGSYDSIRTFEKGQGVYKVGAGTIGDRKWGGLIVLKSPTGGADIKKPFEASYTVAEPSATVSPLKMNVFYLGVDNPVEIAASGTAADKIIPQISQGSIKRVGPSYIVNPARIGNALITVYADQGNGQRKNMGTKEFRVKALPDPVAKVAGQKGGVIAKNILSAQTMVVAELEGSDFQAPFRITSFTVSITQSGFAKEETSNNDQITAAQKDLIRSISRGQRIYFQDIRAIGPDGSTRNIGTIDFKIN